MEFFKLLCESQNFIEKETMEIYLNYSNYLYAFIFTYLLYLLIVMATKWVLLRQHIDFTLLNVWHQINDNSKKLYSPDYFSAAVFKSTCKINCNEFTSKYRKTIFIKRWNKYNLILSSLILIASMLLSHFYKFNCITFFIVYIRYFSRCFEISIAFIKDILSRGNVHNTFLNKYDRVILAGKSYMELYALAASVYLTLIPNPKENPFDALTQSLNVGTLTNIAGAQLALNNNVIIFIHVFSTMSLVVLSLATYLSRSK